MSKNDLKGEYLQIEEGSVDKTIYLYPRVLNVVEEDKEKLSEEEGEIRNQINNIHDECEGEILKLYKSNMVVEVADKNKEFIKENQIVNIRIVKANKAYECSIKILGMKNDNDKIMLVLSTPVVEKEIDRRRFFRIETKLKVRYCLIPSGEYKTLKDVPKGYFLKTKQTLSLDISAGGIKIISEENCEVGRYVLLCIYFPNKVDILCKVVRVEPYQNGTKSILNMKYVCIEEIYRDKIVEYVIKSEGLKRRKEKEKLL